MIPMDITGEVFGNLHVLGPAPPDRNDCRRWRCQCSCGNVVLVRQHALRRKKKPQRGCSNCATRQHPRVEVAAPVPKDIKMIDAILHRPWKA